jgi:hypothetical protein
MFVVSLTTKPETEQMTDRKAVPLTIVPGRELGCERRLAVVQSGKSEPRLKPGLRKVPDSLSLRTGRGRIDRRSIVAVSPVESPACRTVMQLVSWDGRNLFSVEKV